jgi:hypothetical protein
MHLEDTLHICCLGPYFFNGKGYYILELKYPVFQISKINVVEVRIQVARNTNLTQNISFSHYPRWMDDRVLI